MHLRRIVLISSVALLAGACSSAGSSPSAAVATPAPAASASQPAETRIDVKLTDALRIEPAEMTVTAGQPVTFVVTNTGATDHEFYLGDEAAQAEQEEMMQSGQMAHDTPDGISLKPGETKELTFTFETPGQTLAGCHVAGHYEGGMKATITING